MARDITTIKQGMLDDIANNATLNTQLNSSSLVAIYRLFVYVVAGAIWALEKIFDTHKSEVESIISSESPGRLLWYQNKALAFQFGYSLPDNSDVYTTIDETAQIIKFAAVGEVNGYLQIKVAKDDSGSLSALAQNELDAFTTYMELIKYAGVLLRIISQEADHLKLTIDLYYDPLVLDGTGARLDGTNNTPIQDTITTYLEDLPFNGEFTIMALTDALQATDGVKIPQIIGISAYYGTADWAVISAKYTPEAGWLKIYDSTDLVINWIPYGTNI